MSSCGIKNLSGERSIAAALDRTVQARIPLGTESQAFSSQAPKEFLTGSLRTPSTAATTCGVSGKSNSFGASGGETSSDAIASRRRCPNCWRVILSLMVPSLAPCSPTGIREGVGVFQPTQIFDAFPQDVILRNQKLEWGAERVAQLRRPPDRVRSTDGPHAQKRRRSS